MISWIWIPVSIFAALSALYIYPPKSFVVRCVKHHTETVGELISLRRENKQLKNK